MSLSTQAGSEDGGGRMLGYNSNRRTLPYAAETLMPIINAALTETKTHFVCSVELPGVEPSDLEVQFNEKDLVIKGKKYTLDDRDIDESDSIHLKERTKINITRTIQLPHNIDLTGYKSSFKNGLLQIKFPRLNLGKTLHVEFNA